MAANDPVEDRLHAEVHDRIYGRPVAFAFASFMSVAIAWACALLGGIGWLYGLTVYLALVSAARILLGTYRGFAAHPLARRLVPPLALAYAAGCGALGLAVMLEPVPADTRLLAIAYLMIYATGIPVRSAGMPRLALSQSVLTTLPVFVGCLIVGSPSLLLMAALLATMSFNIVMITFDVFNTMAEQRRAADRTLEVSRELHRQARIDPLTGLANRDGFELALAEHEIALGHDRHLALFWIDLHRFRAVNDAMGYTAGDAMLREVARRLLGAVGEAGTIGRFASDEFVVAISVASRIEAERLASQLSDALAHPVRIEGARIECGAAIGVALQPDDCSDLPGLMRAADLALYHAKAAGRNEVRFFSPEMDRELAHRKEIESELRTAMRRGEISIYFQPVIDLKSGNIRSFEALVRWFHPEKGEIRPDEFIPVAEETGLIITLGNWITLNAARAAAQWPDHVSLAVNLSPVQIKAPGAALGILAGLREAGLAPSRLELEVTESLFLEDDEQTMLFIEQLADAGVRFALDDFGMGYSSLSYIHKYPFSKIKVDRSFVSGPNAGRKSDAIIRAVAEMGRTLDMEIVAEGLETIEQVGKVSEAGCTLGQGYYFSRAVPDYIAAILLAQEHERRHNSRLAG